MPAVNRLLVAGSWLLAAPQHLAVARFNQQPTTNNCS
jgi:hypothetical protein